MTQEVLSQQAFIVRDVIVLHLLKPWARLRDATTA